MTPRTHVQNGLSGAVLRYPREYNWATNSSAPGGAPTPWFPGPCRLTRSRLVTHHCTPVLPPDITQMGGS